MGVLERFRLDEQVAVVTGGSRGIGHGISVALAEAGADVVVAARREDSVQAAVEEIVALGGRAHGVVADVARPDDVARIADEACERFGRLTIWVNNAGGQPDMRQRPLAEVSFENFDAQVALNLKSVWASVAEGSRRMADGGSIINISSLAAIPGNRSGHALYAALKAGMNNLTKSLAFELGERFRVNAVAPGPVVTETFYETNDLTEESARKLLPSVGLPLGRYGEPADIGAAVVFLASPAASWITGECLYVTGGL